MFKHILAREIWFESTAKQSVQRFWLAFVELWDSLRLLRWGTCAAMPFSCGLFGVSVRDIVDGESLIWKHPVHSRPSAKWCGKTCQISGIAGFVGFTWFCNVFHVSLCFTRIKIIKNSCRLARGMKIHEVQAAKLDTGIRWGQVLHEWLLHWRAAVTRWKGNALPVALKRQRDQHKTYHHFQRTLPTPSTFSEISSTLHHDI